VSGLFPSKGPLDGDSVAIGAAVPRSSFFPQGLSISNPPLAQALPGKQADGDLSLIQPTGVLGRVMYGEPIPQPSAFLLAKTFHQGFTGVGIQIIHHQVDGVGLGVAPGDAAQVLSKPRRGTVVRDLGKMPPRLGLDSAHKTQAVRDFLLQHPRVQFHFTPTYSSWLNQVEIWFAKIEREVIARGVFSSVSDLARKLRRYINAYSANARPIQWKYSDPSRRIRSNELTATGH